MNSGLFFSCRVVSLAISLIASTAMHRAAEQPTLARRSGDDRVLSVGAATDSFPRSYATARGRCEGFNVDLLDAVARVMDMQLERVPATSLELERRFQNGEFDFLQAFTPGTAREIYADFSAPTIVLHGAVLVRRDAGIHRIDQLSGKRLLIVGRGSVADELLRDFGIKPASVNHCSSVEEALHLLQSGTHDATFASRLSALSIIERDHLGNVTSLRESLIGYEVKPSFAVHKGNTALLSRLNEGLAVLHHTGEYDRIYERWFGRFDTPLMTRQLLIRYVGPGLTIAFVVAVFAFVRQRRLSRRLRQQAEQLRQSESLLAEAQRIARVGHWRYDVANRSLFCSAETYRILERDPGKQPLTFARILRLISRSERGLAHRAAKDVFRTTRATELTVSVYPTPGSRKVLQVNAQAEVGPEGEALALFGTVQDITQQKFFEEDLRAREQVLRAIYENIPSALGVVESDGDTFRFLSANPGTARLLGIDTQLSLAGRTLTSLSLPPEGAAFWSRWFKQGVDAGTLSKAEPVMENGRRHLSLILIPLGTTPTGNAQLCFLAEDITERKRMDAEMAQGRRLRAVGELVGGIAHEFNNLLTPILLKAELLSTEWSNEPRLHDELKTISRAAQRGADLTRRLLAFGRRSEPKPEEVRLHTMVRANLDLLGPTIDRRIQLSSDVPEDLPAVYVNPSDLHQIILNLLLNARDTLTDKLERQPPESWRASIFISAARFGPKAIEPDHWQNENSPTGWLCLTVRDNGLGMPQEVLERIFEPFYTTKEVGKGTGLGLATVWHLVTRLGGKVTVQSRIGEGTVFQVWLPIVPVPAVRGERTSATHSQDSRIARICLVEDDDLVAHTIALALRRTGHSVVHFRHGADAWRHLSTHFADYDLLLLDLDLPGISGKEIARRARAGRYTGKILVASGRLSDHDSRELDKLGVDFQIEKPFSPQKLHLAVQTCIAAHS